MDTKRTLYEIEVALAKTPDYSFVKNIVAFNVNGLGKSLLIQHECDMLVLSRSGYLTEIEIKRSWEDFKADFKKKHNHESMGIIKNFYYCVPISILDKVMAYLADKERSFNCIITYDESLIIRHHMVKVGKYAPNFEYRKLFLEEQLQVARFGAMRAIRLKEKINDLINKQNEKQGLDWGQEQCLQDDGSIEP